MRKRFVILAALVAVVFVAALVFRRAKTRPSQIAGVVATDIMRPAGTIANPDPARERLDRSPMRRSSAPEPPLVLRRGRREEVLTALLNKLSLETPAESVQKLDQVGEYYWPGTPATRLFTTSDHLRSAAEEALVELILSNRRFLKVLDELAKMPKEEASRLIAAEIQNTLPLYRLGETEFVGKYKALGPPVIDGEWTYHVLPGHQVGNNPDGSPTLQGLRLKLLALALAAGTLELSDARPAILGLTAMAVAQRGYRLDPTFLDQELYDHFLFKGAVFSTRILGTALIGTSPAGLRASADDPAQAGMWYTATLPMYNADRTAHDLPTQSSRQTWATDFSYGRQTVYIREPMTDAEFDQLVLAATRD
jgi:hypothetical protein